MRAPPFSTSHLPRDLHSKQQLELEQNANPPLPWRRASGQRGFIGVPSIEEVFEGCQDCPGNCVRLFFALEITLSVVSCASAHFSQTGTGN